MKKQSKTNADFAHDTALTEAVAFISATLGEPYTCTDKTGFYWSAHARLRDDGTRGYPVALEVAPLRLIVSFMEAKPRAAVQLYALIGWAHYHGCDVEHD